MSDNSDRYIGVQDSYQNAANDTDKPRYGDNKALYEKFASVPEPEVVGKKKEEEEVKVAPPKAAAPKTAPPKSVGNPQA